MLPVPAVTAPRLAGVLGSSVASLRGEQNDFGLPAASGAVVVLVDGLGATNIQARAGHARFLSPRMARRDVIRTVTPSTTAAAIASFTTGRMPGEHGLVGYRVLDAAHDRLVNQLQRLGRRHGARDVAARGDGLRDGRARRHPQLRGRCGPLRRLGIHACRAARRGVPAGRDHRRPLRRGARAARSEPGALVYLYVPELDQAAHAHGWESDRWLGILEQLDAELAAFERADAAWHGPARDRRPRRGRRSARTATCFIDAQARPPRGRAARRRASRGCLSLYFEPDLDAGGRRAELVDRWREAEGERAWVLSRDEAIAPGCTDRSTDEVRPRIGDVIVAARAGVAYYDRREPNRQAESMIGQHGSLSDEETRVPLIRAGGVHARATRPTGHPHRPSTRQADRRIETAGQEGYWPRLTCGFGRRRGRSWMARIAAYQRTPLGLVAPNLAASLPSDEAEDDDVEHGRSRKKAHSARMPIVLHLGRRDEREQDDGEHHGDEDLADAEAGVDVVAHELLLRTAVARGQVALVAGAMPTRALSRASACLGARLLRRLLAVVGDERPLAGGLLLGTVGVGCALAGLRRAWVSVRASRRCVGAGVLWGCLATGVLESVPLKITGMTEPHLTESASADAAPRSTGDPQRRRGRVPRDLADLARLVRIPSVVVARRSTRRTCSAAPRPSPDCSRGTGRLRLVDGAVAVGGAEGRIRSWASPRSSRTAPARNGRPTVLLYAHHDVQPPGRGRRLGVAAVRADACAATACTAAARPTTRRASWRTSARIRALDRGARRDFDLGIVALHRGRGGVRLALVRELPRTRTATCSRADVIIVADSGNWDSRRPRSRSRSAARCAFNLRIARSSTPRTRACSGERCPTRCSPPSGCSTRSGTTDGAVAVEGLTERDAETPEYNEEQLRAEAGLLAGVTPDRRGTILSPHLGQAGDHHHRHRRTRASRTRRTRSSRGARAGQRADRARAGRRARRIDAIEAHLRANAPFGAQLDVRGRRHGQPFLVDTSGWAVARRRAAMARGLGREPVEIGVGGSIPFIAELVERVPRRADPRDRRRGPATPARTARTSRCTSACSSARCSAEALLLARLDARTLELPEHGPRTRTPDSAVTMEAAIHAFPTHRGET